MNRSNVARGQRIDALIRQSGKEPKQLSALWQCSESRISAIRKGAPFSFDLLETITSTMGWSADFIINGNSNTVSPTDITDLELLRDLSPAQRDALRVFLKLLRR